MTATPLLPSGLMDVLPPIAAAEFRLIHHFLRSFTNYGYQPVIPPMAEYPETMLAGQGEATSHHVLRLADPLSPNLLILRADMTGQVARIAGSTLSHQPRPLRLCYGGYTLRAAPEALKTRRQHTQVGIERFGDVHTQAIAEILAIAVHAVEGAGVESVTVDLAYPGVMTALLTELDPAIHDSVREAARLKDTGRLRSLGAGLMADIIAASGPTTPTLARLAAIDHPAIAKAVEDLRALEAALVTQKVQATLTVDMLELSGYGYYSGISYALYWNKAGLEVGRGGCYRAHGEDAVGFTLYINDLLELLGGDDARPIKRIPYGTPADEAEKLHRQGFVTVFGDQAAHIL